MRSDTTLRFEAIFGRAYPPLIILASSCRSLSTHAGCAPHRRPIERRPSCGPPLARKPARRARPPRSRALPGNGPRGRRRRLESLIPFPRRPLSAPASRAGFAPPQPVARLKRLRARLAGDLVTSRACAVGSPLSDQTPSALAKHHDGSRARHTRCPRPPFFSTLLGSHRGM